MNYRYVSYSARLTHIRPDQLLVAERLRHTILGRLPLQRQSPGTQGAKRLPHFNYLDMNCDRGERWLELWKRDAEYGERNALSAGEGRRSLYIIPPPV